MKYILWAALVLVYLVALSWGASAYYYYLLDLNYPWRSVWPQTIFVDAWRYGIDRHMETVGLIVVVAHVGLGAVITYLATGPKKATHKGDAKWATERDIKKAGLR